MEDLNFDNIDAELQSYLAEQARYDLYRERMLLLRPEHTSFATSLWHRGGDVASHGVFLEDGIEAVHADVKGAFTAHLSSESIAKVRRVSGQDVPLAFAVEERVFRAAKEEWDSIRFMIFAPAYLPGNINGSYLALGQAVNDIAIYDLDDERTWM